MSGSGPGSTARSKTPTQPQRHDGHDATQMVRPDLNMYERGRGERARGREGRGGGERYREERSQLCCVASTPRPPLLHRPSAPAPSSLMSLLMHVTCTSLPPSKSMSFVPSYSLLLKTAPSLSLLSACLPRVIVPLCPSFTSCLYPRSVSFVCAVDFGPLVRRLPLPLYARLSAAYVLHGRRYVLCASSIDWHRLCRLCSAVVGHPVYRYCKFA
jgi:hypothetical protein